MTPLLRRCLRELPLALGLSVGLFVAWRRGWAFVLDGAVEGYHWDDYLGAAWMVVHQTDVGYPPFRQPLHGGPGRWLEARAAGHACPVILESTHVSALEYVDLAALRAHAVSAD